MTCAPKLLQQLFLIEVLIHRIDVQKSGKYVRSSMQQHTCAEVGPLRVRFKFIHFPCVEINPDDFNSNEEQAQPTGMYNRGKSFLFPMAPADLIDGIKRYPMAVTVLEGRNKDCQFLGVTHIMLTNDMCDTIRSVNSCEQQLPVSSTLKETFKLVNLDGECVGSIVLLIRLSCFGQSIITQFQLSEQHTFSIDCKGSGDVPEGNQVYSKDTALEFPQTELEKVISSVCGDLEIKFPKTCNTCPNQNDTSRNSHLKTVTNERNAIKFTSTPRVKRKFATDIGSFSCLRSIPSSCQNINYQSHADASVIKQKRNMSAHEKLYGLKSTNFQADKQFVGQTAGDFSPNLNKYEIKHSDNIKDFKCTDSSNRSKSLQYKGKSSIFTAVNRSSNSSLHMSKPKMQHFRSRSESRNMSLAPHHLYSHQTSASAFHTNKTNLEGDENFLYNIPGCTMNTRKDVTVESPKSPTKKGLNCSRRPCLRLDPINKSLSLEIAVEDTCAIESGIGKYLPPEFYSPVEFEVVPGICAPCTTASSFQNQRKTIPGIQPAAASVSPTPLYPTNSDGALNNVNFLPNCKQNQIKNINAVPYVYPSLVMNTQQKPFLSPQSNIQNLPNSTNPQYTTYSTLSGQRQYPYYKQVLSPESTGMLQGQSQKSCLPSPTCQGTSNMQMQANNQGQIQQNWQSPQSRHKVSPQDANKLTGWHRYSPTTNQLTQPGQQVTQCSSRSPVPLSPPHDQTPECQRNVPQPSPEISNNWQNGVAIPPPERQALSTHLPQTNQNISWHGQNPISPPQNSWQVAPGASKQQSQWQDGNNEVLQKRQISQNPYNQQSQTNGGQIGPPLQSGQIWHDLQKQNWQGN